MSDITKIMMVLELIMRLLPLIQQILDMISDPEKKKIVEDAFVKFCFDKIMEA